MSDLKPTGAKIKLGDKEYTLLFDINAIDDIQDHLDIPISQLSDLLKDERKAYKVLKYLLTTLINEGIDDAEKGEEHVTEKFVGRKITPGNMSELKNGILASFIGSTPEPTDDSPNLKSE
jgi:hypothetical protein